MHSRFAKREGQRGERRKRRRERRSKLQNARRRQVSWIAGGEPRAGGAFSLLLASLSKLSLYPNVGAGAGGVPVPLRAPGRAGAAGCVYEPARP